MLRCKKMNHKISEFCDKIDSIKKMSDRASVK